MKLISILEQLSKEDPNIAKLLFKEELNDMDITPIIKYDEIFSDAQTMVGHDNCPIGKSYTDFDDFAIFLEYAYYGLSQNKNLQAEMKEAYKQTVSLVKKHDANFNDDSNEFNFLEVFFDKLDVIFHKHMVYENDPSHLRKTRDMW